MNDLFKNYQVPCISFNEESNGEQSSTVENDSFLEEDQDQEVCFQKIES